MSNQITQKTVLNNGLAVLTGYVSEEATNFVHIAIRVNSGSADDTIDGQAHFLEHMLFNGVETADGNIDYKTLKQSKEKDGIFFGAYTTQVETTYTAQVPISLGENGVEMAVRELSRMVVSPTLPEDRIAHEKRVIHNEWGSRFSKLDVLLIEETYINGFSSSPEYGHRILGERATIPEITRDSLIDFMASHYTAPNMSVSIAGPVQHSDVVKLVSGEFSDISDNNRPDIPEEPSLEGVYKTIDFSIVPHSYFHIFMSWKGNGKFADSMTTQVTEGIIRNHLNDVIREDNGSTYGLSMNIVKFKERGIISISTDVDPAQVHCILREIAAELNFLANGDISRQLETIKTIYRNGQNGVLTNAEYMCDNLSFDQGNFGVLYSSEDSLDEIDAVTVSEVQGAIKKMLEGPINLVGLGLEGTFPSEVEFKEIMRLHEKPEAPRLGREFNL